MPILILYASDHGSTAEIAERISSRIAEQLPPTEVHSMKDFNTEHLDEYTAVILGSAVHGMQWLPDATDFLAANMNVLAAKPLFAFSVGAPASMPKLFRAKWQKTEEKKLAKNLEDRLGGTRVVKAHRLFNGKFEKEDGGKGMAMLCGLCCAPCGGIRYGDFREWEKIEGWADEVVGILKAPAEEQEGA